MAVTKGEELQMAIIIPAAREFHCEPGLCLHSLPSFAFALECL